MPKSHRILCCLPELTGFDGTSQLFIDFLRYATSRGHQVDCAVLGSARAPARRALYGDVRRIFFHAHPQCDPSWGRHLHRVRRRITQRRVGGLHFCPPSFFRRLRAEFMLDEYDLAVACGSSFAALPRLVRCPTLLDMHELFTLKRELLAEHGVELASPFLDLEEELANLAPFSALWCPSTHIRARLARALPGHALFDRHMSHEGVVPRSHEPVDRSDPGAARLLFVGSTARENHPGLRVFLEEIFPRVRRAIPHARLDLVGWGIDDLFAGLDTRGVHAHGRLDARADVLGLFEEANVVVIPRFLGGLTIKGVEALVLGKATVGHPLAFSGCYRIESGREAAIARDSGEFIAHVVRLLGDPAECRALGARARAFALREFDPERVYAPVFASFSASRLVPA